MFWGGSRDEDTNRFFGNLSELSFAHEDANQAAQRAGSFPTAKIDKSASAA
jgi:hypothetical protein